MVIYLAQKYCLNEEAKCFYYNFSLCTGIKNVKFVYLVLEHINYIKEKVGVSGVGIGAEFDASNET